jgi:hypothetical protein
MVATATAIPGATYATSTFTIPWSALTAITSVDATPADSFEGLLYALCQCVLEKQNLGTFSGPTLGVEVSNHSLSQGVVETSTNTFSNRTIQSYLLTFDLGSSTAYLQPTAVQSR